MKSSIALFSPAKINLFFRVLSKRDDGYHNIATRLQALNFGDTLTFSLSKTNRITSTDSRVPTDESNLIAKALALFSQETGVHCPLHVHLEKEIPMEAGLGGGSSNAATTLYAINQLSEANLSDAELRALAAKLGADVPFFFSLGTALCEGFGEIVSDIPFEKGAVWLIMPDEKLSTKAVFENVIPKEGAHQNYVNDLEENAFALLPRLQEIKQALLESGMETVWMTGSGSTLVAIGNANPPLLSHCRVRRANFLGRKKETWYAPYEKYGAKTCAQKSTMTSSLS